MPKFIAIEGTNGSGKQTQASLLTQYFKNLGYNAIMLSFPNYDSEGCKPVKMYLSGEFGADAMGMDAYQTSVLFAVDRLTTFKSINLDEFDYVVLDRYTYSNLIHQASKVSSDRELNQFIDYWLDFEFNKLKLPRADVVIYIDMPQKVAEKLINARQLKFSDTKDIEERNEDLEQKSRENGLKVANKLGFKVVNCVRDDELLSKEEIHQEIVDFVLNTLMNPQKKKKRKLNSNKKNFN